MAAPTPLAIAVLGLFVLIAGGAVLVFQPGDPVVAHQLPVPGGAGVPVVAPPLIIDGPITAPTRVRVVSPVDDAVTLLELDAAPTGTIAYVYGAQVLATGAAAPLQVQGDALHDPLVTFTFFTPGGSVTLRVDRSTAPATVSLTGLPSAAGGVATLKAPVAIQGDLADPQDVAVYDVTSGTPAAAAGASATAPLLFRYHDNGDGTATLTYADPTNHSALVSKRVEQQLVLLEGSPLDDQWRVTVKDATGHPVLQFDVPLATARSVLAAKGVDTGPLVDVLHNALPNTNAYKAASDTKRTLDPANLDGESFLNGKLPIHIDVDVQEHTDLAAPLVLVSTQGLPQQTLHSHRDRAANGWVRYTADLPADWLRQVPDGAAVGFSIVYRIVEAKLVTDQVADDNDGAGYVFKLDQAGPRAPVVQAQLDTQHPGVLHVTWSADDASSGVATYAVQKGKVAEGSGVTWEDWVHATPQGTADFAGQPGQSYQFRVTATDDVGNVGAAGTSPVVAIPMPGDGSPGAQNRAPAIQLLAPTGGESFVGMPKVEVKWRASDPDGTVPVINLYLSGDGGATWTAVASPTGTAYTWDVATLLPGDYRLKVEATDGSLSDSDVSGRFHVDNSGLATADSLGGMNGQQGLGGAPPGEQQGAGSAPGVASDLGGSATLIIGFAAVLVIAGAALAVWKWKSR